MPGLFSSKHSLTFRKLKDQKGFAPPMVLVLLVIILSSGFILFKSLPIREPQATVDKGFMGFGGDLNPESSMSASPSASADINTRKSSLPSAKTTATPQASSNTSPNNNSNESSNNNSSNNSNSNNTTNSQSNNTQTTTSTPSPSPSSNNSSCGSLCFDRGSVTVEIKEGENEESGGWTAFAFNLTGDGEKGFMMNWTGIPAGISLTPTSGGFAKNSTQAVKVWANKNNSSLYGEHSGTITLKQNTGGGFYQEVGTMNITVKYTKKN